MQTEKWLMTLLAAVAMGSPVPAEDAVQTLDATRDRCRVLSGHLNMGAAGAPDGTVLSADSLCFLRDGRPWLPVMGEAHFSRIPAQRWEETLLAMKAGGVQVVATYVFWNHHEETEGRFDWTAGRDLRRFARLCARHGLPLWVRIGPWCHGEVRNGGFPDWLLKSGPTRCDDPAYLERVTRLYGQIGKQLAGLMWRSGGPVIGVQIENEYGYAHPEGLAHLVTLKDLARKAGLDAPYYSVTGWPANDPAQGEFIPVFGGYPEAPWEQHTRELPPSADFLFRPLRQDTPVLRGATGGRPLDPREFAGTRYPYATAELGGGNQITYHRRPQITAAEVATLAYTSLGSGANLLGYYMYAGGSNPLGRSGSLQESRASGYPNDCPLISYDFQAPLGEWGQLRPSYHELRLLHLFLGDYGSRLAPMLACFPDRPPTGPADTGALRWSVRASEGSGFVFLANHQRNLPLAPPEGARLEVRLSGRTLTLPSEPFTLRPGACAIWPLNMPLEGARVAWATLQPVCSLRSGECPLYVYCTTPGVAPELVLDASLTPSLDAPEDAVTVTPLPGRLVRLAITRPGPSCVIKLLTAGGSPCEVLVLTREQALQCWKGRAWGKDRLVLSEADVTFTEAGIRLVSTGEPRLSAAIYPALAGLQVSSSSRVTRREEGSFTRLSVALPSVVLPLTPREIGPAPEGLPAPGIAQPGPLYGPRYQPIPGARVFALDLPRIPEGLADLQLRADYVADTAALYVDDKLVADDFWSGGPFTVGLHSLGTLGRRQALLQLVPLTAERDIYFEPEVRERLSALQTAPPGPLALLREAHLIPRYQATLALDR